MSFCRFVLAGSFLLTASAGTASADAPMPSAGKFSVTYTFTTSSPSTPIEVGGDRDLTVNNYLATMVNDAGSGFLHLVAGHCTNIRFTARTTRTINTKAYCNFRDRDGDVLYVEYTTGEAQPINGISNKWTIVSGTGKYDGITGKAEDTNSNNVGEAGVYQAAGKLIGSYQISHDKPSTAAEIKPN